MRQLKKDEFNRHVENIYSFEQALTDHLEWLEANDKQLTDNYLKRLELLRDFIEMTPEVTK